MVVPEGYCLLCLSSSDMLAISCHCVFERSWWLFLVFGVSSSLAPYRLFKIFSTFSLCISCLVSSVVLRASLPRNMGIQLVFAWVLLAKWVMLVMTSNW